MWCPMQTNFSEDFRRANPDYQNGKGYGVDEPGQMRLFRASA